MDSNSLVTHLSEDGIKSVHDNYGKRVHCYLQFLGSQEKKVNEREISMITLSDGSFTEQFIVYPNIVSYIKEEIKQYDVVKAGVLKKDPNNNLLILWEVDKIYSNIPEIIGKPISYSKGLTNKQDSKIPENIVFQNFEQATSVDLGYKKEPFKLEMDNLESSPEFFTEIASLSHYDRSFKIRGRVIKKQPMKSFRKKDGSEGNVFNIVVKDHTKPIQIVFFNDMALKFADLIEAEKIYSFSDLEIKNASQFNNTGNKYELYVHGKTDIKELKESSDIPKIHFNFCTIEEIAQKANTVLDVIGIVDDPGIMSMITLRSGEQKEKKNIKLLDDTGYSVDITLWGQNALDIQVNKGDIVIFQDVIVKEYNGKFLSFTSNSKLLSKIPDHPRYKDILLYKNKTREGNIEAKSLTEQKDYQIKIYKIGQIIDYMNTQNVYSDSKQGFNCIAYLIRVSGNFFYESCENETCMKKVTKTNEGLYYCDKCNKMNAKPRYRLMARMTFADDSGFFEGTVSGDDHCMMLFNKSIDDMVSLKNLNPTIFEETVLKALFVEYKIRILAKWQTYNETNRLVFNVIKFNSMSQGSESLINSISNMLD